MLIAVVCVVRFPAGWVEPVEVDRGGAVPEGVEDQFLFAGAFVGATDNLLDVAGGQADDAVGTDHQICAPGG